MLPIRPAFLLAALLSVAASGFAHDDATLDALKSPNGGQLRMAGPYHYELLIAPPGKEATAATLLVFVTDHAGSKVPTAGATGKATLLAGGKKTTLALKPEANNRMKGEGAYLSSADIKVIVSIALTGAPAESARFTPWSRTAASANGMDK